MMQLLAKHVRATRPLAAGTDHAYCSRLDTYEVLCHIFAEGCSAAVFEAALNLET